MRTISAAAAAIAALLLCACETTRQQTESGFHPPKGTYHLIVMQPDVTAGLLTAGGVVEPREDWTNQARDNVVKAVEAQETRHGAVVKIAATTQDTGWDPAATENLVLLHRAVGTAIAMHKYGMQPLPTKKDRFDWTLGEQAVAFGAATHYDYALFLHAEDSFSSGGRRALQAAGFLGCLVGVCVAVTGGQQIAFASLVDLKTGDVVWFNMLASTVGDIRTPEGANQMVTKLLESINSELPQQPKRT
jgi:hypothetical protein